MLFRSVATFLLAAVAVVMHLPGVFEEGPAPDFRQAVYAPLAVAEEALARKDYSGALRSFELAGARALRCGNGQVLSAVRNRVGNVGFELAPASFADAWPYISWYCLHSSDFSLDSSNAETWLLDRGLSPPTFEYDLMKPGGERTMLDTKPTPVPLRLYRKFPLMVKLDHFFKTLNIPGVGDIPKGGDYMFIYSFRVMINARVPGPKSTLHLKPDSPGKYQWFASIYNSIWWNKPIEPDAGSAGGMYIRGGLLDRIVVLGGWPPPKFRATLAHSYESVDAPTS